MLKYFICLILTVFSANLYSISDLEDYFNNIFLDKIFISVDTREFDDYSLFKAVATDETEYAVFNTKWLPVVTQGYGGPLDVYILFSTDLTIVDVALSEHSETPRFVDRVFIENEFAKNFAGLKKRSEIEKVDAITRATYTTEAIIERCALAVEFLIETKDFSYNSKYQTKIFDIAAFFILGLSILASVFYKKINRKAILLINLFLALILSVRIQLSIGILASTSSSLSFITIFAGVTILLSLLLGRFYCGFICPFGIIQEFLNFKFKGSSKLDAFKNSLKTVLKSKTARVHLFYIIHIGYILFLLGAGIVFSKREFLFAEILNYYMVFTGFYVISITVIIAILSVIDSRFYCKFICPTGYVFVLLRKISPLKTKLPKLCTSCSACMEKCPMAAIVKKDGIMVIDNKYCIDCKLCIKSCKKT